MRPEDVPAAERLSAEGFYELDVRMHRAGPGPSPSAASDGARRAAGSRARCTSSRPTPAAAGWPRTTPGWSASATSFSRETAVVPGDVRRPARACRAAGIGRRCSPRRCTTAAAACAGCSSSSVGPARRCAATGSPASRCTRRCCLTGTVDRSAIPVVEKVREGVAGDVDLMDSVDRRTRGAAHGRDHEVMLRPVAAARVRHQHRVGLRLPRRRGQRALLAATNRRTATRLLWAALADAGDEAYGRPRHGRERVGDRRRARGPARPAHRGLPRRCAG